MTIWMIAACIIAYFVKGMCGFANTLVFSTILSFTTNNINISPLELLVGLPSNMLIAWQNRRQLDAKVWVPLCGLVILGCIPGAFFLKLGNAGTIKCVFGAVVVLLAAEMFFRERAASQKTKPNKLILAVLGLVSGMLCGLFGIGALLAAYVGRTTTKTASFKGNLCIVFTVENLFRLMLYIATGIITLDIAKQAVLLLPCMAVGLAVGMFCSRRLKESAVRNAIIVLLFFSGLSLILTNLSAFFG